MHSGFSTNGLLTAEGMGKRALAMTGSRKSTVRGSQSTGRPVQGTTVANVLSCAGGSSLMSVSIVRTACWGPG